MDFFFAEVACIPPTPPAPTTSAVPFRFMDLPIELRLIVYKHLVVVGKVFYTPDEFELQEAVIFSDYIEYETPSLAILRVSKTIHDEAEALYLGSNVFVLPHKWRTMAPIEEMRREILFSQTAFQYVKHLSIMMSAQSDSMPLVMCRTDWEAEEFFPMPGFERQELVNITVHGFLTEDQLEYGSDIMRFQGLRSLELDYTNAYCPIGCCRALDLGWDFAIRHAKTMRIVGLRNKAEKETIEKAISDSLNCSTEELRLAYDIELVISSPNWF